MRDEVVMIEIVAKSRQMSGKIRRQTMPALDPVALKMIWLSGPADDEMTWLISPATNSKQERNTKPVKVPIATQ